MSPRRRHTASALVVAVATVSSLLAVTAPPAGADPAPIDTTERITLGPAGANGGAGDTGQIAPPQLSTDGRLVVFASGFAFDPTDTVAGSRDTYLRDRLTGAVQLVGVSTTEQHLSTGSTPCGLSGSGRYVGFTSTSPELGGAAGRRHVYVRDRALGTTTRVSVSSAEVAGNGDSDGCDVSADGTAVALTSEATNLVAGDTNAKADVFVRYLAGGTTVRASVSSAEGQAGQDAFDPSIDADGSVVGFTSFAQDLVAGTEAGPDVFLRNIPAGTTALVSRATGASGDPADPGESREPDVSSDGSVVAFTSGGDNLVAGDTNGEVDIFVRDLGDSTTVRVSRTTTGAQLDGEAENPTIDSAGTEVAYETGADNAGAADIQVYLRTIGGANPVLVSKTASDGAPNGSCTDPALSGDASVVTFLCQASNMVRSDPSIARDVYARAFGLSFAPFGYDPNDPIDAFIRRQYVDFIGRQPTTAERSEAQAVLRNGEENPDMFIDRFAHSTTWSQHRAPVARLYWAFFLRLPEDGGLTYWTNRRKAGRSLSFIASNFAASSEFQNTYGSLTNAAFVTKIYQNIFDREPDAGGQTYWTNQLNNGNKSRGDVMVAFSESSEGKRYLAAPTDTVLVLRAMLGAMPNGITATLWIESLRDGLPIEGLIRSVRHGQPYEDRVQP